MSDIARLRWLCRRGMKELDLLLTRYLDNQYVDASEDDQQAFEILLQMPDPELYDLILGRTMSQDAVVAALVSRLQASLSK